MSTNKLNLSQIGFKSSFELAASKLGFNGGVKGSLHITSEEEQEALLKLLYYAGYLDPNQLWRDLNNIGGIDNPRSVFEQIHRGLIQSNAMQKDAKQFNAALLRKSLFGNQLDEQDSMDFLLYIAQHAFNRKKGQERDSLIYEGWMKEYKDEYLEAARILGLIDRIKPSRKNYDLAWIAGTSHPKLLARTVDYFFVSSKYNICIKDETSVLTGEQELYAEIQGIDQAVIDKLLEASKKEIDIDALDIALTAELSDNIIDEGKKYIAALAKQFSIALKSDSPFIVHKSMAETPYGRKLNKLYPNYEQENNGKITESLMVQGLLRELNQEKKVSIITTSLQINGTRPTTATTVNTATRRLVQKIKNGDFGNKKHFFILLQSNQPYVERQTITAQQEVDKVLSEYELDKDGYQITIDGMGFKCKEAIYLIHSVFGALMAEKWGAAQGTPGKRDIKDLLFQTRKCNAVIAPCPIIVF